MTSTIENKDELVPFPEIEEPSTQSKPRGNRVTAISHKGSLNSSRWTKKSPTQTANLSEEDVSENGLLKMGFDDVVFKKIKSTGLGKRKVTSLSPDSSFEEHVRASKLFHGKDLVCDEFNDFIERLEHVADVINLNSEEFCLLLKKYRETPALTIASALCRYDVTVSVNRSNGGKWVNETCAFAWRKNIERTLFKVKKHTRTECSMIIQDMESQRSFEVSSVIEPNCTNQVKLAHPKIMLFWDCVKKYEKLLKVNGLVHKVERDLPTVVEDAEALAKVFEIAEKARKQQIKDNGIIDKTSSLLDEANLRLVVNLVCATGVDAKDIYSRHLYQIDKWGKAVTSVDNLIEEISMTHDLKIVEENEDVCTVLGRRSDTGQMLQVEATTDDIVQDPERDSGEFEDSNAEKLLGIAVKALTKMCFPDLLTGAKNA